MAGKVIEKLTLETHNVKYEKFLKRFTLNATALEPLYPLRESLIHLMHTVDEKAVGYLHMFQFRAVCRSMRKLYGEKAYFCDRRVARRVTKACNS